MIRVWKLTAPEVERRQCEGSERCKQVATLGIQTTTGIGFFCKSHGRDHTDHAYTKEAE